MHFEKVLFLLDANVAVITMNRPEALNALSLQLSKDLDSAIDSAISGNARAVVLTGKGRAFCSGGDLREMQSVAQVEGNPEAYLAAPLEALHKVIRKIRET